MSTLTLTIEALEPPPGWRARWSLDDRPIDPPIEVAGAEAQAIPDLSRRFLELFEGHVRPLVDPEALRAIGRVLFATWFEPAWESVQAQLAPGPHELLIRGTDRDVLNLPWELVELSPDLPVGCDAAWSLRRTPLDRLAPVDGPLEPGPLRILFLAAAPVDQAALDYEREEDAMLRATAHLRDEVVLHFAETGSFDELAELVAETRPHVVHLSGHGKVHEGSGTFAFEDERGKTDSREAGEIVANVFRGSPVRCVFFNGCQTSQAAVAGLCQALVGAGVPLVLGWAASVADDMATEFTESFYRRLIRGEPVAVAAAHARHAIRRRGQIRQGLVNLQDATFALPQVYCSVPGGELYDRAAPPIAYAGPRTEYTLLGDGIKGLRQGYVGRRREGQRLVPTLRDGDVTLAVITGLGGAGKSTLATRAANRLKAAGFRVVPVRAVGGDRPADGARQTLTKLIDALDRSFLAEQREDLHGLLTDGKIPMAQRLKLAVEGLNELRLALVLDNFEDVLELETRRIADPELAGLYAHLATHLTRGSCVLVTCRYLPAETPDPAAQPTIRHVALPDLEEHNVVKFLRRDPVVDRRIHRGELPENLLALLHRKLGGTPGFLEGMRRVLRTIDPDELREELEGQAIGALSAASEQYYQRIFASRLFDALPPEARELNARLALSELPLPLDAVTLITGLGPDEAARSLDACVAFGLAQPFLDTDLPTLYHPPGLLRPWLTAPERLAEADARRVHGQLAAFWRSSYDAERETELRVPIDVELLVCREHAQLAGDGPTFRWATVRLAWRLQRRAEWRDAQDLLEQVPDADRDADCLLVLADVETSLGDWKLARRHLERASKLLPDGTAEKASAWHNLATIDLREGDYPAAR